MMNYLKKKIENSGIDVYDTPKVIGTYLIVNKILYGSMLVLCYRRHSFYNFCKKYGVEKIFMNKFPKIYMRCKNYYNKKVISLSNNKIYNKATTFIGLNPKNTINTIFETGVLYKLCLPVSFPTLMYVSMYPYRKEKKKLKLKLNNSNEQTKQKNED